MSNKKYYYILQMIIGFVIGQQSIVSIIKTNFSVWNILFLILGIVIYIMAKVNYKSYEQ